MKNLFTQIGLCLLFICISFTEVVAQAEMGIYFQYQPTTGNLVNSNYQQAFGLGFEIFTSDLKKNVAPYSIQLGLQLDVMEAGSESYLMPRLSTEEPEEEITVCNLQIGIHPMARIAPSNASGIKPYVDLIAGIGIYGVEEMSVDPNLDCPEDDAITTWSSTKVNPEVGIGAGLMIPLGSYVKLDMRASYLNTGRIPYANLNTLGMNEGFFDYQMESVRSNLLDLQIGVVIAFNGNAKCGTE
ncbi:MAG: hypothetical protein AAFR66_24220 [Bacteroidota bacterium]